MFGETLKKQRTRSRVPCATQATRITAIVYTPLSKFFHPQVTKRAIACHSYGHWPSVYVAFFIPRTMLSYKCTYDKPPTTVEYSVIIRE
jgi:hypothetical protein